MSYLATISEAEATGATAQMYEVDGNASGYLPNFTKIFSPRPEVYTAWKALNGAVKSGMDLRRYEVATVAAAGQLRSSYCALAHGEILAEKHLDEAAVRRLVDDSADAELEPLDAAIAHLATKIARSASDVVETDYDELRALGLADDEILDIVLATAARCFFSTVLDATGTLADPIYRTRVPESLRDALTVGRSIAPA
jgi:uncharacterized peroxidase-related enzyme